MLRWWRKEKKSESIHSDAAIVQNWWPAKNLEKMKQCIFFVTMLRARIKLMASVDQLAFLCHGHIQLNRHWDAIIHKKMVKWHYWSRKKKVRKKYFSLMQSVTSYKPEPLVPPSAYWAPFLKRLRHALFWRRLFLDSTWHMFFWNEIHLKLFTWRTSQRAVN